MGSEFSGSTPHPNSSGLSTFRAIEFVLRTCITITGLGTDLKNSITLSGGFFQMKIQTARCMNIFITKGQDK